MAEDAAAVAAQMAEKLIVDADGAAESGDDAEGEAVQGGEGGAAKKKKKKKKSVCVSRTGTQVNGTKTWFFAKPWRWLVSLYLPVPNTRRPKTKTLHLAFFPFWRSRCYRWVMIHSAILAKSVTFCPPSTGKKRSNMCD
mmetsp:Transcript_7993/g.29909  ORF Transcript_7993/g.29909 Transcript_7993/m.29909 type:complete len:139 (-) Transcript_7993:1811-2227(-)